MRKIFLFSLVALLFSGELLGYDTCPGDYCTTFKSTSEISFPAQWGTYTDDYGTTIRRFATGPDKPYYINHQITVENSDGTLAMLDKRDSPYGLGIYSTTDGTLKMVHGSSSGDLPRFSSYSNAFWSATDPKVYYWMHGTDSHLYKTTINTTNWTYSTETIADFSSGFFPATHDGDAFFRAYLNEESTPSWDMRYWPVQVRYGSDTLDVGRIVAMYDKDANGTDDGALIGYADLDDNPTGTCTTYVHSIYSVNVDPKGDYLTYRAHSSCTGTGTVGWITWARTDLSDDCGYGDSFILANQMSPHFCMAYDTSGNSVLVSIDNSDNHPKSIDMWFFDNPGNANRVTICDGTKWDLQNGSGSYPNGMGDVHIGVVGRSANTRHWVALVPTDGGSVPPDIECGDEQYNRSTISFIKCDPSGNQFIWRMAHERNEAVGYSQQCFGGGDFDGEYYYYNSNWCSAQNITTMRAELPENWWLFTSNGDPRFFLTSYAWNDEDATAIGNNYPVIITKTVEATDVATIKGNHPSTKTFYYDNALTHGSTYYVLDTVSGKQIVHDTWGWTLMDISDSDYRASLAAQIVSDLSTYSQFDGVFLDDVWLSITASDFHQKDTEDDPNLPADLVTNWQTYMAALLTAIKTAIGSDLLIINANWAATNYLSIADGQMDENFSHANWEDVGEYLSTASWVNHLDAMIAAAAANKYYFAQSGVTDGATQAEQDDLAAYCYASYLLGTDGGTYTAHYFIPSETYADDYSYEIWDKGIGTPTDSYSEVSEGSDVYKRPFSGGVVIVNPTDASSESVVLSSGYAVILDKRDGKVILTSEYSDYPLPDAEFSASQTSGFTPLTVNFTDSTTNSPTSWSWDFDNDSVEDSSDQNPSYEFAVAGSYTITLTVMNENGSDIETKTAYINVNDPYINPGPGMRGGSGSGGTWQ